MSGFEYKVVPAPQRGLKAKGVKGTQARFANALETVMNTLGADGWEYQRTDTLPVEERVGLTGKTTSFQNMLVFRRALAAAEQDSPVVAALIEDQTQDDITPIDAPPAAAPHVEDDEQSPPAIAATEETAAEPALDETEAPAKIDTAAAEQAANTLRAEDRVSETLKAPFAFPWNKRAAAKPASTDDLRSPAD